MGGYPRIRLGYLVREVGGSTPSKSEPAFWGGGIPWVSPKDMKRDVIEDSQDHITKRALAESSLKLLDAGAVLMVVRGMILAHTVPVAVNARPVTINQDMKALIPLPEMDPTFLRYVLNGHQHELLALVEEAGHGTCCLRSEQWRNFRVPVPPLDEQRAIADLLDRKTRTIDEAIAVQMASIERLAEQRASEIDRAVTRGITPSVKGQRSMVPWLEEVPVHWEVQRLKTVMGRVVDCLHSTPEYSDQGAYPAIRTADISPGCLDLANARRVTLDVYRDRNQRLEPASGDIIYSREGERYGMAACVPPATSLCLGQRVVLFRVKPSHCAEFMMWVLNSSSYRNQVQEDTVGATSPRVNISTLREARMPVPPLAEQHAIVEHIEARTAAIDAAADVCRRQITKLTEYRQSIITAAVTGRLAVGASS